MDVPNVEDVSSVITEDWYCEKADLKSYVIGQLAWAPVAYREEERIRFIREGKWDTSETQMITGALRKRERIEEKDKFKHKWTSLDPPISNDEEMICFVHKRRLVILLATLESYTINGDISGERYFMCLPKYTIIDDKGNLKNKVKELSVKKVKLLNVPNLLWLPSGNRVIDNTNITESFINFDSCQVFSEGHIRPLRIYLADKVVNLLSYRVYKYMFGIGCVTEDRWSEMWEIVEQDGRESINDASKVLD